ncbi:protein-L-isoaspartate O-methyltransferase domain-containing protein 1-like isoform X2 [Hyposmocoma kahamanoa]|uniref:protein-L-isoaspartate O-methyltransferase domain-containing protein 1-like isoform X2 n=1 Tax=Hyposmocoma kahamanoa TaxID=1477025 RepID=UPI000E6D7DC3|nr:protein-L-isoaspartate O-methyltransferase domain-containing protein 1-like isoform X2 [Hyposmocoma kahamanoa]
MGGAVSSGRDNNELIDNLMGGNYIRTRTVERVFRALDRADYMTPEARDQAYKDMAWRSGPLHISAPCIYSEVLEGLELKAGLSFLNVGSGTGYLSTLVGLIIGTSGISHGIEINNFVVEYATKKLNQFIENSATLDEFDFCEPRFYCGNGLCLAPLQAPYDRVYCGAGCPEEYQNYFKQLIKVGGILVLPLNDNLLQVRRLGSNEWSTRSLLNVSFATMRLPLKGQNPDLIRLDDRFAEEQRPARLQALARGAIRAAMRGAMLRRHPELREPPPRAPPAKKACPRRICIPFEEDSDHESLNALHDLDPASGGHEMNALLSLVLSMGHNRVAGALRVDSVGSPSHSDTDDSDSDRRYDDDDNENDNDASDDHLEVVVTEADRSNRSRERNSDSDGEEAARRRAARDIILFEFSNQRPRTRRDAAPAPAPLRGDAPPPASGSRASPPPPTPPPRSRRSRSLPPRRERADAAPRDSRCKRTTMGQLELYLGEPETASPFLDFDRKKSLSEEETTTTESTSKARDEKRQKFDSGLGEENTPSSSSSPGKSGNSDDSDCGSRASSSLTDDDHHRGRRRRQKRGHGQVSHHSSSSTDDDSADDDGDGDSKRHRRSTAPSDSARRVRLSILMKRGVKELPLPQQLKKYVNLGRCFEF